MLLCFIEDVVSKPPNKKKTSVEECQCCAELLDIQKKLLAEFVRSNELNLERNLFLEKINSSLSVLATKQYSDL
ncbi:hypothetical protein DPMN_163270 [Dreissena polymorpha]|uniref:Uncharacterized protein n=1 Tax=Dreissena polymorpha TaxID=45954 RepID=A0A9D4ERQ3_DREPO|nr:hypothetical protein DPMN_163270 [Dreissena polymorpha]